jgi:hypothetical protein
MELPSMFLEYTWCYVCSFHSSDFITSLLDGERNYLIFFRGFSLTCEFVHIQPFCEFDFSTVLEESQRGKRWSLAVDCSRNSRQSLLFSGTIEIWFECFINCLTIHCVHKVRCLHASGDLSNGGLLIIIITVSFCGPTSMETIGL